MSRKVLQTNQRHSSHPFCKSHNLGDVAITAKLFLVVLALVISRLFILHYHNFACRAQIMSQISSAAWQNLLQATLALKL